MTKVPRTILFAGAGLLSLGAAAQSEPMFKLSGFGTLAATRSSEDQADFITNFAMPNGPGYTRSTDLGVDSRSSVQKFL